MPPDGLAWVAPADLVPWAQNPRHNDGAVPMVAASIQRFGFGSPIVARPSDRRVIAGHTRLRAAESIGMERVPVRWLELDDDEAAALALADNRLTEVAEWDADGLASVLRELELAEVDLDGLGWSDDELDELLHPAEPLPPPTDDPPPPPTEPQSREGEVYELGPHRLVCGDCTDVDVWGRLERGNLVLTDPPYGVGIGYSQHDDSLEALRSLAAAWLPLALDAAPAVVFTPGVTRCWLYPEPAWVLCWFYGGGQHRGPWGFNCWQPILCYGKDPSLAAGSGCRPDAVDLNVPANAGDIDHPCPKPLALWEWLMRRLVFAGNATIIDPFGGSGTTLLVAASLGHRAMLIERDPAYCDVIRQRWTAWAEAAGVDPGPGALRPDGG